VADLEPAAEGRLAWLRNALGRSLLIAAAVALVLGLVGGIAGWLTDRGIAATIAVVYYLVGCGLFLVGMIPSGGFSMARGTITRRRPLGSRFEPALLLGLVLVGLGVAFDLTRPF
jgi:hypothetical protein